MPKHRAVEPIGVDVAVLTEDLVEDVQPFGRHPAAAPAYEGLEDLTLGVMPAYLGAFQESPLLRQDLNRILRFWTKLVLFVNDPWTDRTPWNTGTTGRWGECGRSVADSLDPRLQER